MADLAATGEAEAAGFAHRIRRKIVMQHEVFAVLAGERIDDLFILAGAEGRDDQRLCFAAREQRAAVRPRQQSDVNIDGADAGRVAAVDATVAGDDVAADNVFFQILELFVERLEDDRRIDARILGEAIGGSLLDLGDPVPARAFNRLRICLAQIRFRQFPNTGGQIVVADDRWRQVHRLLGAGLGEFDDYINDRLEAAVAEHDGAEHHVLRQFARLGLNHQHAIAGACDDEIEPADGHGVPQRIEDVGAIDVADPAAGDGAVKRHARQRQCRRRADHCRDVRIVLQVV